MIHAYDFHNIITLKLCDQTEQGAQTRLTSAPGHVRSYSPPQTNLSASRTDTATALLATVDVGVVGDEVGGAADVT
eukprot:scaffold72614_cov51-Phaeocystis_antarctica.AAC.2